MLSANFIPSFKKDELSNVSIQGFYRPFKINITPYSLSVVQTICKKVVWSCKGDPSGRPSSIAFWRKGSGSGGLEIIKSFFFSPTGSPIMLGANPVPEGPTEDMTPGGLATNAISCILLKKSSMPGGQIDELSGRVLLFFFVLTSNSLVLVSYQWRSFWVEAALF